MNAKEANRKARVGQVAAEKHEPSLRDKYEAALRANASRVATAYRKTGINVDGEGVSARKRERGITAAGKVPTLDEVLADATLAQSATARTKAERQRIAEEAAHPIITEAGKRELRALVEPFVAAQAGVQAERIVAGVRDRVAAIMLEALTEGYSVPDTAALLKANLELDAVWQAEMLARTDLISLSNAASHAAAASLEDGPKFKTWLSAGDDRVRPTHVDANGQIVPIDAPYKLAEGVELQYPGDPDGPDGETINCRCVSVFTDSPARLAHSSMGGITPEPMTQYDTPVAAAGFDETKHPRYGKGDERGGQFSPKDGTSTRAATKEAEDAAAANQETDAAGTQLSMVPQTAERSMGRDVRLTGKLADGKVYRVENIKAVGTKGNTLVSLVDADGNRRQVFGFVEVEDVSQGFQAPGVPVGVAPGGPATPTEVPGPEAPVVPEPTPEPPAPEPTPEPPAPPPAPEPPKPVTPQVSNPTPPMSPAVARPVPVRGLKPGEKFKDSFGHEHTVVGPYAPRPRTYVRVIDENGQTRLMRLQNTAYVMPDHPAIARVAKTQVSHVTGAYGPIFNKTPGPSAYTTEAANAASLEAANVISLPEGVPQIELKATRSNSAAGQYWSRGAKPEKITLRTASPDSMVSTMHHETGHYLDHGVLGPLSRPVLPAGASELDRINAMPTDRSGLYASAIRHPEVMGPVMDAIDSSAAIARVHEIASAPAGTYRVVTSPNTPYERSFTADRKHARYLLEPTEKWARAYEQYQAVKNGVRLDAYEREAAWPLLRKDLVEHDDYRAFYGWQWTPEDFAPIEAEIDKMFGRLGWSKS